MVTLLCGLFSRPPQREAKDNLLTVQLDPGPAGDFGLALTFASHTENTDHPTVTAVTPEVSGCIQVGDVIVQVDDVSLERKSRDEVLGILERLKERALFTLRPAGCYGDKPETLAHGESRNNSRIAQSPSSPTPEITQGPPRDIKYDTTLNGCDVRAPHVLSNSPDLLLCHDQNYTSGPERTGAEVTETPTEPEAEKRNTFGIFEWKKNVISRLERAVVSKKDWLMGNSVKKSRAPGGITAVAASERNGGQLLPVTCSVDSVPECCVTKVEVEKIDVSETTQTGMAVNSTSIGQTAGSDTKLSVAQAEKALSCYDGKERRPSQAAAARSHPLHNLIDGGVMHDKLHTRSVQVS